MGQRIIIEDLLEAARGADPGLRQAAVTILNAYFSRTRLDYSVHTRSLLSGLIRLLNDSNPDVLSQSWDTISSITKVPPPPPSSLSSFSGSKYLGFFVSETRREQPARSDRRHPSGHPIRRHRG